MSDFMKRLSAVQKEIGVLEKSSSNPFFKSKYADITSMLKRVQPILEKYEMLMLQPSIVKDGQTHQGTCIYDLNSDDEASSWCIMPKLDDPQKQFACSTYFRRLTLQNLLAVPSEDDDGNFAAGRAPSKKASTKKQPDRGDF